MRAAQGAAARKPLYDESDGTLLFSQKNGEFEPSRRLDAPVFVDFLKHWQRK